MIDWMLNNGVDLVVYLFIVKMVASLIVAITPTPNDDKLFGKFYHYVLEILAGIWSAKSKELPSNWDILKEDRPN
jgi:hypothetical protein